MTPQLEIFKVMKYESADIRVHAVSDIRMQGKGIKYKAREPRKKR